MSTVTVYSDAGYTTEAQAAVAVSGATFTVASDTSGCTVYYVQGTNSNGDYARNTMKVCVCGLEAVTVPDSSTFVQTSFQGSGSDTIAGATVQGWFSEDFSNAGTITACGIQTYALYTDSGGTTAWTDTAKVSIAGTQDISVVKTVGYAPQTIHVVVTTLGLVTASRQMQITVCGYETVTMTPAGPLVQVMILQTGGTQNTVTLTDDVTWAVDSTVCPLYQTTLYSDIAKTTQVSQVNYGTAVTYAWDQGTSALTTLYLQAATQAGVQ